MLGRLSVFAWLLCRCRLSVRLCLLWCFCLAVFRCFCCVCVCVVVGCVAARLVAAVQLFGVPFVSPSSLVLVLGTWAVGFTLGFPWCMSRHVMFFMLTLPLFSRARCLCVCVCVCVWVVCRDLKLLFKSRGPGTHVCLSWPTTTKHEGENVPADSSSLHSWS